MEKAWAKLLGSYARTISGSTEFAATHLLGMPAKYYHHEDEKSDHFWTKIRDADKR
jgi:hypothetical protein